MIIKNVLIEKFRAIENTSFDLGSKLTAIVGHNGTMKTTVLGILSQTFSINKTNAMYGEKTIDNYGFRSQFGEKFKLSEKDIPGTHKWKLTLYNNIHKTNTFEAHSIYRDKSDPIPRFWSTEGKVRGTGYPQIPVYYLSLKRVTPIGEEDTFDIISSLTKEEMQFLLLEYKEILDPVTSSNLVVDTIESFNKYTASIHNNNHDPLSISAGQDNLGKILIAILSFKRLMENYPSDYKGSLLLIDEIESTFHPLAQERLIKRLYKYARDYKIQFIFTTHSPTVIKTAFFDKHNTNESQLVYLKKVGELVTNYKNVNINDVINELNGKVSLQDIPAPKIEIFSEDIIAQMILKNFLSGYKSYINFNRCSIGAEEYIELLRVKLEPLKSSIVILDGDKRKSTANIISKLGLKNVIYLPTDVCPEEMFYKFLFNLDPKDNFWDSNPGGYDKVKCFSNYPTLIERSAQTAQYKNWFEEQRPNFGQRACSKLLNYWKLKMRQEYESFLDSFINCYNKLASQNGNELIIK